MIDMKKMWEFLDAQALTIPVPKSHQNSCVNIFCNDCFKVSPKKWFLDEPSYNRHSIRFAAIDGEISFHRFKMCLLRWLQHNEEHQNENFSLFQYKRYVPRPQSPTPTQVYRTNLTPLTQTIHRRQLDCRSTWAIWTKISTRSPSLHITSHHKTSFRISSESCSRYSLESRNAFTFQWCILRIYLFYSYFLSNFMIIVFDLSFSF